MAFLEGRNLRKTYNRGKSNHVDALRGVDIAIEAGEMVAIMGRSGSGKSTLMHILGLLHEADRDGGPAPELYLDGRSVAALGDRDRTAVRAREMGFVFQDFNLIPTLTAIENILLACSYAGTTGVPARAAALDALGRVDLAERGHHRPAELSGGEQQRVAVARALAHDPLVLLADEPTGNLDERATWGIFDLFREINVSGTAVLFATHNLDLVRKNPGTRVIEIDHGNVVFDSASSGAG